MNSEQSNKQNAEAINQMASQISDDELAKAMGDQNVDDLMHQSSPSAPAPPPDTDPDTAASQDADPEAKATAKPQRQAEYQLLRGRINRITGDDVFVDLTGVASKMQGLVPLTQFERPPRVGSIMDFVTQRIDEKEGIVYLSREGAVAVTAWDQLQRGSTIEARVTASNKGGLELEMAGSIRGFMPASQIDLYHVDDLEQFVGQKLVASVQEVDRRGKGRVILSRRRYLEREQRIQREKLLKELAEDQVREGVVKSLTGYGAFVDLGGMDGLLHISDMSHAHIDDPKEMVKVGDKVSVKVLKIDAETKKIRLGLKQIGPDPWESALEQLSAGEQISGRVTRLAEFGAFVEVQPGVEGLVPMAELSWKRIRTAEDVCKTDDVIRVVVLAIDKDKRRISLSLKQAKGDPWVEAADKYPVNSLVEGKVVRTTEFGAFIEIEEGLEGLVHISELDTKRVEAVEDVLTTGQTQTFRVLEVNSQDRRVRLSLKAVKEPVAEKVAEPASGRPGQAPAKKKPPRKDLKGGMGKNAGLGIGLGDLKL